MSGLKREKEWEYIERLYPTDIEKNELLKCGWKIHSILNDFHGRVYLFERKYITKNCDSCEGSTPQGLAFNCEDCEDFSHWHQKTTTING